MMRLHPLIPAAAILLTAVGIARADQAYVLAGTEEGQAIVFHWQGVCFAVTPKHVMAGGGDFASLTQRAPDLRTAEATTIRTFGEDLALVSVQGGVAKGCGETFAVAADVAHLVAGSGGKASMRQVFANGDTAFRPVRVVSSDTTELLLEEEGGWTISPGDSGSSVMIGDEVVGIVQDQGGPGKPATALRWDYATRLIDWELSRSAAAPKAAAKPDAHIARVAIEAVNTRTADERTSSANLTAAPNADGEWRAEVIEWPVDLIVSFQDGLIHSVRALVFEGIRGNADLHPRAVEIQRTRSAEGNRSWLPYSTVILDPAAADTIEFPGGMEARRLRIRIYNTWGKAPEVGLRRVKVTLQE